MERRNPNLSQALEQCYSFWKNYKDKHKVNETLFQDGEASINTLPFPKHDDWGKGQAMMASHCEGGTEKADEKMSEQSLILIRWLDRSITCSNRGL